MRILLTGASLMPSYGGPAFSVSRLASALAESGVSVGLWAADQSARITTVLPAGSPVCRLIGTEAEALDRFGKVDVLQDSGIWLRHNHRFARLAIRRRIARVVSTRGMLEPWALNHRRWKKNVAWLLYQRRDLTCARCLHTTSEQEAQNVGALGLSVPVCTIPNGIDLPEAVPMITEGTTDSAAEGARKALFLGRVHPNKGLPMLIEAWARLRPQGWVLRIAGPDEAGHRAELEQAVSTARLGDVVSFLGPLDEPEKRSALFDADLLVLPTHSENFGMVVGEALAHGLPVLTTTGAPWPILPEHGCGWRVQPTVDGIVEGLHRATSCDRDTLRGMGIRGRDVVATNFRWEHVATQFLSMYERLLAQPAFARA